jgi:hypothetical protein
MRINLFAIYLLFAAFASFSQGSGKAIPTYKEYIGKTFTDIKTIDTALGTSQFGILESNKQYGVSIYGNSRFYNKKTGCKVFYVFFTKEVGRTGPQPIEQILDVVTIDMKQYSKHAQIRLDQCSKAGTDIFETVAVYYHDEDMAAKGITVKPEKAWHPNVKTGKLEEVTPAALKCGSEAPAENGEQ